VRSWIQLGVLFIASAACEACRSSSTTGDSAHQTGPANLKAVGDCDAITVSWDAQANINAYSLLRSERRDDPNPPMIQQVKAPPYQDLTQRGVTYYYWVKTNAGISGPAVAARTDLPAIPSDVSAHGDGITVEVTWSGTSKDYDFQESFLRLGETKWTDGEVVQLRPAKQKPSFDRFFNHVHQRLQAMRFRVRAVNECGESNWTEWKTK
jgi:hypothetical protein